MILIRKPVKQKVYDGTFIRPRIATRYDYMCNEDDVPIEFIDVAEFVNVSEAQKYMGMLGYTSSDIFDNDIEFYEYREPINWQPFDDCDLREVIG